MKLIFFLSPTKNLLRKVGILGGGKRGRQGGARESRGWGGREVKGAEGGGWEVSKSFEVQI